MFITLPINEKYKEFIINDGSSYFTINKSEFKDSLYILYLPQSNLPSIFISVGNFDTKHTSTLLDFSKSIIQKHNNSLTKVYEVNYKSIISETVGEVSKVSFKFEKIDLYNINYSFIKNGKVITIGYSFINDNNPIDRDEDMKKLEVICP